MGINFKKRSLKKIIEIETHPRKIYEKLDRQANKGQLRDIQIKILDKWYAEYKDNKDVILKLPTGEGKTLIGLLILQSKINKGEGPAVYLCPNKYLVKQVQTQAKEFGVPFCSLDSNLPSDFVDGSKILICTSSKLFNGRSSNFGIGQNSIDISSILLDDAHSCIEIIKQSCTIKIKRENGNYYNELFSLFRQELKKQGMGTFLDIENESSNSILAVPYWDWYEKIEEVTKILYKCNSDVDKVKDIWFPWEIIKDNLKDCLCVFTGKEIEITPYKLPIKKFRSFFKARHRVFMSATLSSDSFFIKDLGVEKKVIENPLTFNQKWSGERMILIPSLIDESLSREIIINWIAKIHKNKNFNYGIISLVPSFEQAKIWEGAGAKLVKSETIEDEINKYKNEDFNNLLVFANRYDGIDFADSLCRILILDSEPQNESISEKYYASCIGNIEEQKIKKSQTIEQGLGRAVRGEKDYCVVLIIGNDLIKRIRYKNNLEYFSNQTKKQIEMGFQLAEFAKEDKDYNEDGFKVLSSIIRQSLKREEDWKNYYDEQMNSINNTNIYSNINEIIKLESESEELYENNKYKEASKKVQNIIDNYLNNDEEKGWFLQKKARYLYPIDKIQSCKIQISAHQKNKSLFLPQNGYEVTKISLIDQKRNDNIKKNFNKYSLFSDMMIDLENLLSKLSFGVPSEKFETAIDEIGKFLGFVTDMPDKYWKTGPDNIWAIKENYYLCIECKNEVLETRVYIEKDEVGQFNTNIAWFNREYKNPKAKYAMIIPTKKINKNAAFSNPVVIMTRKKLDKLSKNIKSFAINFKELDLNQVTVEFIEEALKSHKLTSDDIISGLYWENSEY
ncbi:DEAD/DEAH box helicase [Pigmentibacter ruber]